MIGLSYHIINKSGVSGGVSGNIRSVRVSENAGDEIEEIEEKVKEFERKVKEKEEISLLMRLD